MIEATCGACGTIARIAETDVPAGAKFVTCASCKSRVLLPQLGAAPGKPAPKSGAIPPIPRMPPPIPSPSSKPTVDLADLPAPKKPSPLAGAGPSRAASPPSPLAGVDLPAPKGARPSASSGALDLDDLMPAELPAPKAKSDIGLADLPAPRPRASALGDAGPSRPAAASPLADLPAPKGKASPLADLPAPKKPSPLADLPAPKAKGGGTLDLDDLPMPRGGASLDDGLDLPMPKPGANNDLPMPKPGANNDLPMPKPGANNDLPAPKGFFDDLPQPAKKGGALDLPAPKGFFDDLPQPAAAAKGGVDLPAPKGFFDDLPQPSKAPTTGALFDDLPQPNKPAAPQPGGPSVSLFDDIAPPSQSGSGAGDLSFSDIELGPGGDQPLALELDVPGGPNTGRGADSDLDIGLPLNGPGDFTDLDLSEPSGQGSTAKPLVPALPEEPASPIKIKTPKGGKPAAPIPITVKKDPADLKLDLAEDPHAGKVGAGTTADKGKRKGPSPAEAAETSAKKRKRTRVVLASVLGLALAGAGGFYFYQKHTAAQEKTQTIETALQSARKALADANPNHWSRAAIAANQVLELEPNHVPALGIAAEAAFGGALDTGVNYDSMVARGRTLTQRAIGVGKASRELDRARALMAIAASQPDRAIQQLQPLINSEPKNGWLQLYMGWAQLAKGDAAAAQSAFEQAVALDAATKLPALYGHGQARLLKLDLEGARTDFSTVLETAKDHIGAQVGLAATLPPQQSAQREADLLAILNRPELDKADPRAVVEAWTLAGDIARQSGRLDIARERYRKALAITALDLDALTGLAAVELRDGKIQVARDLLQKALTAKPEHPEALLLEANADIVEGRLPDAESKLTKLAERQPPLPPLQLARLHVAKGRMFDAQSKHEEAIAEYTEGAKLAGDLDLMPTMAAVTKLTELAKAAPDEATATGYRARADQLLSVLAEKSKEDGGVALTLGVAYLQAGDAQKGQEMLTRAVALREKDPEARLQLARALSSLGRTDDAIAQLKEALAIDPARGDVSLELARTYQNAGRDTEAMAAYEKLLAGENVDVIVRVNAGRYFASRGAFDKAAAQAAPILAVEPENAGGLYLKGEGLILAKKWDEARIALTRATDLDHSDAQALDALGRAFDGSFEATNDGKFIESARHAYDRATKAAPKMFHPHLGLGRALVRQGHFREAVKPLEAATSLDKTNSQVMYTFGQAYYGLRNDGDPFRKLSASWFESALKHKPELSLADRAETNFRLGELYFDLNKAGDAARAFDVATRLGEQMEKDLGKGPTWLTDTFYKLGQVHQGMNNKPAQKRAWQRFVDRNPPPSERLKEAKYALATTLKTY